MNTCFIPLINERPGRLRVANAVLRSALARIVVAARARALAVVGCQEPYLHAAVRVDV